MAIAALAISLAGALPATAAARDYAEVIRNVLVPGESGAFPPNANSTDQLRLFDALTPKFGSVSSRDLTRYFKPETFTPGRRARREKVPMRGLRVVRDRWGVAHVYGKKRAAVEFGAGWVTAEDRSLFIEAIRGPARVAALDVPGLDAFALGTSLRTFVPSAQTESYMARQQRVLRHAGRTGRQVLRDTDAYTAGINAYYRKTHNTAKPWTRNDVLSIVSLIGARFGRDGGSEAANSDFLARLEQQLGAQQGLAVFRDLSEQQDADRPNSLPGRFPYEPVPSGPTPGSLVVDPGSFDSGGGRAKIAPAPRAEMSNALLVGASRSATHHPLAVMGPQVGFFYPEFLMELDLHGGGLDVRGAALPGAGLYVLVGRGKDFAWSATSSNSDNVDQFAEQLCNPDGSTPTRSSTSYVYKGRCVPMQTVDAGLLKGASGQPDEEVRFRQTVHGPVSGTVTAGGKPYAIATDRSTRGREPATAVALERLNENKVRSAKDFLKVINGVEFCFDFLYADSRHIAMFSTGRLPVRAAGTDPSLPTLGTGPYDWRGFLRRSQHPHAIDPKGGIITNWNNPAARGWGSADTEWSYGSMNRVELLRGFKRRNRLKDVAAIMNRAATQDARAVELWPVIARVLAGAPAPDPQAQQAANLVTQWVAAGGSRLDRNGDGKVDAPGAAVFDVAYPLIGNAVLSPVLGPLTSDLAKLRPQDESVGEQRSSYFGYGWYSYIDKDLRTQLGERMRSPYSRRYCGAGSLPACRASLWSALQQAAAELARSQGPDPNGWHSDANAERIQFQPGVLTATMRWANRPTFQQVVEFSRHRR